METTNKKNLFRPLRAINLEFFFVAFLRFLIKIHSLKRSQKEWIDSNLQQENKYFYLFQKELIYLKKEIIC